MQEQYQVISTRAGYAVQNTKTYSIVGVYTKGDAERICNNLNDKPKPKTTTPKLFVISEEE